MKGASRLIGLLLVLSSASVSHAATEVASAYKDAKAELIEVDQTQRDVLNKLYEINQRMRFVSKRRDYLGNQMIAAEADVRILAKTIAELESDTSANRAKLSKRLRAIYTLGDNALARALFASSSGQEVDQTLKYLKILSERDQRLIRRYEASLKELKAKKTRLDNQVRALIAIRERVRKQESLLDLDQAEKMTLLSTLKGKEQRILGKVKELREQADADELESVTDTSFFEFKGAMKAPVEATLVRGYGMIEDPEFRYRLTHKGHLYKNPSGQEVRSIFHGRVVFIGEVPGHGKTVVLDHGDHYYSVYSLNRVVRVAIGDKVSQGQVISESDGELYFEVRHFSDAIDPAIWISVKGAAS